MNSYRAVATCAFGLESILSFELKKLGVQNVTVSDGRVSFEASTRDIVRANLWIRTAERVLIVVSEYRADTFDELFDGARAVNWSELIARDDAFPVKGYSMNSMLTSVPACQKILKKALVESLRAAYNTSTLPETGNTHRVQFSLVKGVCTLMLDTTGDGLHKRGYRPLATEAPIKETLAAGIADLARVKQNSRVVDPFCGSGTLVIESALRARNIAPGLRRSFACESFHFFDPKLFAEERQRAQGEIIADTAFEGFGSDIDAASIEAAERNAQRAGVSDCCRFCVGDARQAVYSETDIVLANPPYGERIMDERELEELYKAFAKNLTSQKFGSFYMITNYPLLERDMGRPAGKRRKLYNGMIPCQLYMYY